MIPPDPVSMISPGQPDSALVSVLVDADGWVRGGILPPVLRSAPGGPPGPLHLRELLQPYDSRPFPVWWAALKQEAGEQPEGRAAALLKAGGELLPVTVVAAKVDAGGFIIVCQPMGYRRLLFLSALYRIGVVISRLDLDDVLRTVREGIAGLMPLDVFLVGLYDHETGQTRLREFFNDGRCEDGPTLPPHQGLTGWVVDNRKTLFVRDVLRDPLPVAYIRHKAQPLSRSLMLAPLIAHEQVVGVLSIQSYQPDTYTEEDLWMLEAIAAQTAVALANARLYSETAARLETLVALQDFSMRLSTALEDRQVAEAVGQAVLRVFQPEEVLLYFTDRLTGQLRPVGGWTPAGTVELPGDPANDGLLSRASQQGEPRFIGMAGDDPALAADLGWSPEALALLPIRRGEQRFGLLAVLYRSAHHWSQDEQRALDLIVRQAAATLDRNQYHDSLARRLEQVSALYALAQRITGQLNSEEILTLVVNTLRDIFRCRACAIALCDPDGKQLTIRAAAGIKPEWLGRVSFPVGEGIAGRVVATGQPIYVPDVHAAAGVQVFDPEVHSVMAVPIATQGRVIGSLNLDSAQVDAFLPEHEHVLTIAAAQVAAALEISRLYRQEAERSRSLAAANAELQRLEKLRQELLQNLSHELRTPLTYIKGYGSLLQEGDLGTLQPPQQEAVQIIMDRAEAIERLISDVVRLEQISEATLERESVEINQLARQALQAAQVTYEAAGLVFELRLAKKPIRVEADRRRLNQAIDNLLSNAVKFTPRGGKIIVATRLNDDERTAEISVADTGIGIAPEHLPHLFERFFQARDPAHPQTGGSGIGLALVRRIMEAHGGQVRVESQKGRGSCFTLVLPCPEQHEHDR